MVLNRILDQKRLRSPLHARLERRANDIIEQECAVHQRRKARNLQPLESLPTKSKTDNPDEQRAAGVDGGARRSRNCAGHRETEEVEATRSC